MQVMHDQEMPMVDTETLERGRERGHVVPRARRVIARKVERAVERHLS